MPSYLADNLPEQIKTLQRNGNVEHEFSIFWVPRRTLVSDKILEEEGVLGDVSIAEMNIYFFPLESDVLSLELENGFSDLYLVRPLRLALRPLNDCSEKTQHQSISLLKR